MDELLNLRQLAESFHLPADWLKGQAVAGNLPHLRVGRRLLFNRSAVGQSLARMAAAFPKKEGVPDAA